MEFHTIYRPITATPFKDNKDHIEVEPCDALKPYIRCFWGTNVPNRQLKTNTDVEIVIPDTCMDIIIHVNHSQNKVHSTFCALNDTSFQTYSVNTKDELISTFGIRFFAWSAILFSEESLHDSKNKAYDAGVYFPKLKRELESMVTNVDTLEDRKRIAEKYLIKHMRPKQMNSLLTESIYNILRNKGNIKTMQLAKEIHVSTRQIERIFEKNIGMPPKVFSSLIRYQYLWNDILFLKQFDILDAVAQYGYTDQSHLSNDFKSFHTMPLKDAREYARKDVAFLQEKKIIY